MKIRAGFVSNSSSSSFIIHKHAFASDKARYEFIEKLDDVEKLYKEKYNIYRWNDCDETYSVEGDFIIVGTHYAPEEVLQLCDDYIVNKESVYKREG